MKDYNVQRKFLELRGQGKSFNAIEQELGVSKPTLIKWGREFQEQIENIKAIELDSLMDEFYLTKKRRVEVLGELHKRAIEEVKNRDLSEVPTAKLIDLTSKLSTQLAKEFPEPIIRSEAELEKMLKNRQAEKARYDELGEWMASGTTS
ncbi:MAG: hypothetical protein ACXV4B_07550 [Halobacteriota archaeon]